MKAYVFTLKVLDTESWADFINKVENNFSRRGLSWSDAGQICKEAKERGRYENYSSDGETICDRDGNSYTFHIDK